MACNFQLCLIRTAYQQMHTAQIMVDISETWSTPHHIDHASTRTLYSPQTRTATRLHLTNVGHPQHSPPGWDPSGDSLVENCQVPQKLLFPRVTLLFRRGPLLFRRVQGVTLTITWSQSRASWSPCQRSNCGRNLRRLWKSWVIDDGLVVGHPPHG